MAKILQKSYAKINISLNIEGRRNDGYHYLDSVMLPIELHDSILVSKIKNGVDNLISIDDFSVTNLSYNLANLALNKYWELEKFDEKFRIAIHKVIPIQGGLGGGSSNAAFTIKAVQNILKKHNSDDQIMNLLVPLGADIPFFVKCTPCRVKGIGEIIEPIQIKNDYYVLLVMPKEGCSTRAVYTKFDEISKNNTEKNGCNIDNVLKALAEGDDDLLASSIGNDLEAPAISLVPEIQNIKDRLKSLGLKIVQMTGSGSAVFALSTDKKMIKKIAKIIDKEDKYFVEVTKVRK